jgi:hypothetical protein
MPTEATSPVGANVSGPFFTAGLGVMPALPLAGWSTLRREDPILSNLLSDTQFLEMRLTLPQPRVLLNNTEIETCTANNSPVPASTFLIKHRQLYAIFRDVAMPLE